jgi:hypothetical protein
MNVFLTLLVSIASAVVITFCMDMALKILQEEA